MYHPVLKLKPNGAPVISGSELDTIGERLVTDFLQIPPLEPKAIDIDRFVTRYLHMGLDYKFLSHSGLYLGTTIFTSSDKIPVYIPEKNRAEYIHVDSHTIIIDDKLEAEVARRKNKARQIVTFIDQLEKAPASLEEWDSQVCYAPLPFRPDMLLQRLYSIALRLGLRRRLFG